MTTCTCPNCGHPVEINPASLMGKRTSPAKKAAARLNANKPCAPGKKRGRPRKETAPD